MTKPSDWKPDTDSAIRALIKNTIGAAGDIPPDQLPHHVRKAVIDQIGNRPDLDQIVADILKEETSRG